MKTKEQNQIIADYMRYMYNEERKLSDKKMIAEYGGDTSNEIIVDFGLGRYLYKSVDSCITVYNVIDICYPEESFSGEPLNY